MYFIKFIVIFLSFHFVTCQDCESIKTCGDCVGYAAETCVWCSDPKAKEPKCQAKKSTEDHGSWCIGKIYDPQMKFEMISNNDFNAGKDGSKVVQFKPQSILIKVRPGVPVPIKMSYKPAEDYPLDVYYLIDYSHTMEAYADALRNQGQQIYSELKNITNNVRLGIGSYVDKPSLPFADLNVHNAYAFKNHLSLTDKIDSFVNVLTNQSPDGSNYDVPEGDLDALMQAIVCKQINWRAEARRIIVLSTDSQYHIAGDGKMVEAIKPHDMKCYLNNENKYSEALTFDYPSISQINKVASEYNTRIIFAVTSDAKKYYDNLANNIDGSVSVLLEEKSNVAVMIKEQYLNLLRKIELGSNIPPFMDLKLEPNCMNSGNCSVKHKETFKITGTLTVKFCPKEKNAKYNVAIGPKTLPEKLDITIEIDCVCDCEIPKNTEPNSRKCNGGGTLQCGICACNKDRYSKKYLPKLPHCEHKTKVFECNQVTAAVL